MPACRLSVASGKRWSARWRPFAVSLSAAIKLIQRMRATGSPARARHGEREVAMREERRVRPSGRSIQPIVEASPASGAKAPAATGSVAADQDCGAQYLFLGGVIHFTPILRKCT